jgi:hypothetical protein
LLGRLARASAYLSFLRFDSCHCKLGLDEAEPDMWFLLILGTKFNLRSYCCSDRGVKSSWDKFARLEKVGKSERFGRLLSHEE